MEKNTVTNRTDSFAETCYQWSDQCISGICRDCGTADL